MPDSALTANIALLIDADNASHRALDPVLTVLAELGTVNIRRAYGNWRKPALKAWADLSIAQAIQPYQQFDLTKGKNATDMRMTIDAMDMLYSGRVQGFGLMSSDSDFTPLVMRIRQDGLPVYGFGASNTPEGFRQACTRFIDVGALLRIEEEPIPSAGALPEAGKNLIDEDVIRLLTDAWKASKRDERNFARLSEVGQRAANRSSFDKRNYGVTSLSELLARIPNFTVEQRDDGHSYVKRVR
ncbi:NYN domain-containing protein [Sphingobium sp. H39-3-25]|uniref:NYN domain-containing protein n=1 Tax=Sphingobium arseniciresistens TaxID=3030834 RepID=UPI0023B93D27|nr:NYN domain-containing protein [Sphingobium arseniciresistens]